MVIWYKLEEDKSVTPLPKGQLPDYKDANRIIKQEHITIDKEDVFLSTVFLCLDHSLDYKGAPPILFETMIFGGKHNKYQRRYATYQEALDSHLKIAKALEEGKDPDLYFEN